jgi:hypothetical protein
MNKGQGGCDDLISQVTKKQEPKCQGENQKASQGESEQKNIGKTTDNGEMAMKCPNCGVENPEGQKFCGDCGGSLDGPSQTRLGLVKCPNCGFDNPEGRRFCADCGSMIPRTPRTVTPAQEREKKGV